jgi:c-di-GMP-binding flagellar brake protein YcgR
MTETEKSQASAAAADPQEVAEPSEKTSGAGHSFDSMKLHVGARLQFLVAHQGKRPLFSTLIGYVPNEYIIVRIPYEKESASFLPLAEGARIQVRVFSGETVFSFVSFVDRLFHGGLNYVHLSFPRHIEASRLRNAVRVQVDLPVQVEVNPEGQTQTIPVRLANVSVDGACILSERQLGEIGSTLRLSFDIVVQPTGYEAHIDTAAFIRSVSPSNPSSTQEGSVTLSYGIEFDSIEATQKIMLQNLIYKTQIEDRRKVV